MRLVVCFPHYIGALSNSIAQNVFRNRCFRFTHLVLQKSLSVTITIQYVLISYWALLLGTPSHLLMHAVIQPANQQRA